MDLIEMRTAKITEKGQISIPTDIRKLEGFRQGNKVAILAYKNKIEIRPLKKINESMFTMLASEKALAKDWLAEEEDEAWKDL
ncbi:MAG: AbrB/MazE/SpoVT family DNA-binding domain-containing protein [Nanoarchaeota archaeon]